MRRTRAAAVVNGVAVALAAHFLGCTGDVVQPKPSGDETGGSVTSSSSTLEWDLEQTEATDEYGNETPTTDPYVPPGWEHAPRQSAEEPIGNCSAECPPVNCPCLTSAKVELIAVYIKKFRPRGVDNEPGSPWVKVEIDPGVYDLMSLREDLFAGVNARNIPPGHYSMIRLTMRGQGITFCDDPVEHPFYVAQENKQGLDFKKGIKIFETFYICPDKHTRVSLKFPEDGLLTWIKSGSLVRMHPKIWVQAVEYLPL